LTRLNTKLIATTPRASRALSTQIALLAIVLVSLAGPAFGQARVIRMRDGSAYVGQQLTVPIELVSLGTENAVGFSLSFNQTILTNAQVSASGLPTGAQVNINTAQVAQGRVGIAIALPAGQKFTAGIIQLASVTFVVAANATNGSTTVAFGDQPVTREVSSDLAVAQPVTFTPATVFVNPLSSESAAGGKHVPPVVAPDSIVAGFGLNLTNTTAQASTLPLPTTLGNVTLTIKDITGTELHPGLLFVSPGQINYVVPAGTASGPATVTSAFFDTATPSTQTQTFGTLQVAAVSPGIFTANQNAEGVPSAYTIHVKQDNSQVQEDVFVGSPTGFVPKPIDLDPATDSVFLVLFGTGIRGRSELRAVTARIGGANMPVAFAAAQPAFAGLDQVNIILSPPQTLKGRGTVNVVLTVDGVDANTVQINIK
jgi:uncharacterized protein (TIGR03437 family)